MSKSRAEASWTGSLQEGSGVMKPAHAESVKFGVGTRFKGETGSNPEELIGAALAGCFSMALAANLGKAGATLELIETQAEVELEKDETGFFIPKITLLTTATVGGVSKDGFQRIAEETKKNCPVSRALAGPEVELKATLVENS